MNAPTPASAGVTLTAKGECYATKHASGHRIPVKALRALRRLRKEAEAEIERLLALVDKIDGDADLEPSLASPETVTTTLGPLGWGDEPEGIWRTSEGSQTRRAAGGRDDREGDAHEDDEEGGDSEPSLGSYNIIPGRVMVDGSAIWPEQSQAIDAGMDQRDWIGLDDQDLEAEHDGREPNVDDEEGHDAEQCIADELGLADKDAMADPTLSFASAPLAFDRSGQAIAKRMLRELQP